jgi:hypothetical protein
VCYGKCLLDAGGCGWDPEELEDRVEYASEYLGETGYECP